MWVLGKSNDGRISDNENAKGNDFITVWNGRHSDNKTNLIDSASEAAPPSQIMADGWWNGLVNEGEEREEIKLIEIKSFHSSSDSPSPSCVGPSGRETYPSNWSNLKEFKMTDFLFTFGVSFPLFS